MARAVPLSWPRVARQERYVFVVIEHRLVMRGRASGAQVETSVWDVVTFRDRRIVREQWFLDRAEARRAAGLDGD